ncbi:unnamed protein product [Bursaphelenchus okinawaensis]|uniref:MRG domain-containing protein n=1 Tax=Bursaphelenchus okinawaensis TaxID=465554 RepID=A0A811LEG3_9BILA|nr:unnamed protein product [Bursaphelenchus okinawaensis]CAG9122336.1 unnamed protein product [Bursaphelenchus okinawaensis]
MSNTETRFLKFTEAAAAEARDAQINARTLKSKKKKTPKPSIHDIETATSSRSTTPSKESSKNRPDLTLQNQTSESRGEACSSDYWDSNEVETTFFEKPPKSIVKLLVQDARKVKQGFLIRKHISYSVDDIVKHYIEFMEKEHEDNTVFMIEYGQLQTLQHTTVEMQKQIAYFICDLFNCTLRQQLLYDKEKAVFQKYLFGKNSKMIPSSTFGITHLVRLLTKFTKLLAEIEIPTNSVSLAMACAQDFFVYVAKNVDVFYDATEDYIIAQDYGKLDLNNLKIS